MSESGKVKIVLNRLGIREILKSQMVMDALEQEAEKIGEIDSSYVGILRCNVSVKESGNAD